MQPDPSRARPPALSPVVYEIAIFCLEISAAVLIAGGLGVAAFALARWAGFLVVCGSVLLAAGWLGDRLGGRALAAAPAPPGQPPATRSKDEPPEPKTVIAHTWWRFAWLNTE